MLLEKIKLEKSINKIKIIKMIVILFLIMDMFVLFACLFMSPQIDLKYGKEINIKYPSKYKEPGYSAKVLGKDISKKVLVKGKISNNPGTYKVTYIVKNFIFKTVAIRTVNIIDDQPPKIILKGNNNVQICPGTKYKEEGFEVTDNYDKDIVSNVEIENNDLEIIYRVKDSSNNKAQVIRKVIEVDNSKPEIKLNGSLPTYISLGSKYKEPGYSATDNCDGDLTKSVKVTGEINSNKPGKYYITYTVSDKSLNTQTIKREVIVQNVRSTGFGCGLAGAIYLTFDDGPSEGSTTKILDILKEEGVKATFFVTNNGPDYLIKRAYDEGHTIALHTATHNYSLVYASVDNYFNDLKTVSNRVKRITGYESKFIRFPGGSSNIVSKKYSPGIMSTLTQEVVNRGYKYYDWNISSEDAGRCAKEKSSSCVYNNAVLGLSKNRCNMILLHDIKFYTADALRDIIKYGKSNNYIFRQIDKTTPMVKQHINN